MPQATNTRFTVAVHVLTYLAGVDPGHPVTSEELAVSVNVNPVHIRRVLGPLRAGGLVRSRPGQHGGWTLGRPAEAIGLDELWSVVGGADRVIGMHGPNPSCPVGLAIASAMAEIDGQLSAVLRAELARRTVRDLLDHVRGAPTR